MKKTTKNKKTSTLVRNNLIFLAGAIILVAVCVLVGNLTSQKTEPTSTNTVSGQYPDSIRTSITQDDIEEYCQDVALLNKYINTKDISIVALEYSPTFYSMQDSYDINGDQFYFLSWSGKNNKTRETIEFACWISGKPDAITLHYLSIGGNTVFGSLTFETYDKNGVKE